MFVTPGSLKNAPVSRFKRFSVNVRSNGLWVPDSSTSFQMRNCKMSVLHREMKLLTEFIIGRFTERFDSSSLLEHFKIFIPTYYLGMPHEQLDSFGWDSFKVLLGHFAGKERGSSKLFEYDGASMQAEFLAMKKAMWQKVNELKITDATHMWGLLRNSTERLLFPKVLMIANIMFIIPVQTAVVERGFSLHRIVKNRLTNSLKIMTLDSLLRIKLLTLGQKLEDFKIKKAVEAFSYVPIANRRGMMLSNLFEKVNNVELGLLGDGIDEGDEPNLNFSPDDELDDELDGELDGEDAWLSDEDENEDAALEEDVDCFGERLDEQGDESTAASLNQAAELDEL